jgi:hypothetical protein
MVHKAFAVTMTVLLALSRRVGADLVPALVDPALTRPYPFVI